MLDNWKQVFAAAGVKPSDAVYFAFSFGPFLGFWTAFEAACQIGCRCLPGGGLSSVAPLAGDPRQRRRVLCCTPTYALHLGRVAEEERIDPIDAGRADDHRRRRAGRQRARDRAGGSSRHGRAPRSSIITA